MSEGTGLLLGIAYIFVFIVVSVVLYRAYEELSIMLSVRLNKRRRRQRR